MFGLINLWWNVYFVYTLHSVIPINLLLPGCKAPYWAMWNVYPLFLIFFLDVDVTPKDPQMGQGELQDTLGDFGVA